MPFWLVKKYFEFLTLYVERVRTELLFVGSEFFSRMDSDQSQPEPKNLPKTFLRVPKSTEGSPILLEGPGFELTMHF